jgi:hypothetical protein
MVFSFAEKALPYGDCHFRTEIYTWTMRTSCFIARLFLWGGGLLAAFGSMLWLLLPIKLTFPPFLPTALLAFAYGLVCLKQCARIDGGKRETSQGHESGI